MKKILVIGASGGIGRVVAKYFIDLGYVVFGTNFKNDFPDFLKNMDNFKANNLDLAKEDSIAELYHDLDELEAIVNCAGVIEFEAYNDPSENLKIMERTMSVNFHGSYLVFELLRSKIRENGSYIMMSSTDANFGGRANTAYATSKAGVNSLTKSLALQFQDSMIRVNTIAPGWVETAMMEAGGDKLAEYARSINPLLRNGEPQDVADLVEFLISDKSSYINGQVITLDGGYTLQDPTLAFEEEQIAMKA